MKKPWKTATLVLTMEHKWRQATPAMQKAYVALWTNEWGCPHEREYNPTVGFAIDTHVRSGEFTELVRAQAEKVRKQAKGRKIWWISDPNEEWMDVVFLFGEAKDILKHLATVKANKEAGDKCHKQGSSDFTCPAESRTR